MVDEEGIQDQALQEMLEALEDRIAEYEAKKAWYSAKLVELASRRVALYEQLTGGPPALSYVQYDGELASLASDLEEMAASLAVSARRMQQKTRALASRSSGRTTGTGGADGGEDGTDRSSSNAMRELLQSMLAAEVEGDQGGSPDVRKLALQLLPRLLKESADKE